MNIKISTEIRKEPEKYLKKNIKMCGLIFKVQRKQSPRGRWASIQLNDLGGTQEIIIYSDVLQKYDDYLVERNLILIDAEIKNENNQTTKIIAKKIDLLNDYISDSKYNITLFISNYQYIYELVPLIGVLDFGQSNIFINSSNEQHNIEIKIKENIKLSSKFINDLSKINGVDNIIFS